MKKYLLFFVTAVLTTLLSVSCGDRNEYDVYLLIGQSNMAGRGTMIPSDTVDVIDGVWLLDPDGKPEPAKAPLNKYSTIRKNLKIQQMNPGVTFSEEMHKATGHKILLVVNAKGGSSLEEWMKSNRRTSFFGDAVFRAGQAKKYGDIKAVLWHQGESNSGRTGTYMDSLQVFVSDLRQALGDEKLPFVAGEIARWHKNADAFNGMISHISEYIPYSYYVSSEGCTPLKDESDPHFSRDGQLLLGKRYAEKILELNGR